MGPSHHFHRADQERTLQLVRSCPLPRTTLSAHNVISRSPAVGPNILRAARRRLNVCSNQWHDHACPPRMSPLWVGRGTSRIHRAPHDVGSLTRQLTSFSDHPTPTHSFRVRGSSRRARNPSRAERSHRSDESPFALSASASWRALRPAKRVLVCRLAQERAAHIGKIGNGNLRKACRTFERVYRLHRFVCFITT